MTFYIGTPYKGTASAEIFNGNDLYLLASGITVWSTGGDGLSASGGNNVITIEGTLIGYGAAIYIQSGSANVGNRVTIAQTGVVLSQQSAGIASDAGQTTVINHGLIAGQWGVDFSSSSGSGSKLVNTGRIIAQSNSVDAGSGGLRFENTGTVTTHSTMGANAYDGAGGIDDVINRGLINGNVDLGSASDSYDGAGGQVKGWIWGNAGSDQLKGGSYTDLIYGGVGSDTILGRGGRDDLWGDDTMTPAIDAGSDVFDYNSITDSGVTSATRDVIRDFNNGNDRIDLSTIDANTGVAGNQAFSLLARGTAASAVGTGKIGWYFVDSATNVNDRTILRINTDADAAIEMTIELVGLKPLSGLAGVDFIF